MSSCSVAIEAVPQEDFFKIRLNRSTINNVVCGTFYFFYINNCNTASSLSGFGRHTSYQFVMRSALKLHVRDAHYAAISVLCVI